MTKTIAKRSAFCAVLAALAALTLSAPAIAAEPEHGRLHHIHLNVSDILRPPAERGAGRDAQGQVAARRRLGVRRSRSST